MPMNQTSVRINSLSDSPPFACLQHTGMPMTAVTKSLIYYEDKSHRTVCSRAISLWCMSALVHLSASGATTSLPSLWGRHSACLLGGVQVKCRSRLLKKN